MVVGIESNDKFNYLKKTFCGYRVVNYTISAI